MEIDSLKAVRLLTFAEQIIKMPLNNLCLKVTHNGKAKVVGKITLINDTYVFYHAHKSSQRHRLLDALAIDVSVVEWLRSRGIEHVHYYDVDQQRLRVTSLKDFLRKGIRKSWGNRDRYCLRLKF